MKNVYLIYTILYTIKLAFILKRLKVYFRNILIHYGENNVFQCFL